MRLERASTKAIKYAIMNWHYSKTVPPNVGIAYAVFNDNNEWCGVVCYGAGATNGIAEPYGLKQGEVIELIRVALNGKQQSTSKVVSISLRLIKKDAPLVKMVVSYADSEQGHFGTIYQASNWYYTNFSTDKNFIIDGKQIHRRSLSHAYNTSSLGKLQALGLNPIPVKTKPKWKYIYPLDRSLLPMCKAMSKPYPKKEVPQQAIVAQEAVR